MFDAIEVARLAVAALTPLSVASIGWVLSSRLKALEQRQWGQRKIIDQRIALFGSTAEELNRLLCFSIAVGEWRNMTPDDVWKIKINMDRKFHSNQFIFGDSMIKTYRNFINSIFDQDTPYGQRALLKVPISGDTWDREHLRHWNQDWRDNFASSPTSIDDIKAAYKAFGSELRRSFDIP